MKLKSQENMTDRKIIISGIIAVILVAIGICIGVFIKNFPGVSYKNEIDLFSGLTFLVTLGIGVVFPFLIKKWIDDNNTIKQYIVLEIESLETLLKENMKIIDECYQSKTITSEHRDRVNFVFFNADLQIESIENQFKVSFPNNHSLIDDLKLKNGKYYHFLTGGNFMISDFTIDARFFKEHKTELNHLTMHLKQLIHKIHKI